MKDQLTSSSTTTTTSTSSFCCPSFSSYAAISNTAANAVLYDQQQQPEKQDDNAEYQNDVVEDEEYDDFEFVLVRKDLEQTDSSASLKGEAFPLFDRSLLNDLGERYDLDADVASSSSEDDDNDGADDLEGVAPGTYCVWKPSPPPPSPSRCEKSNSTGSSSTRKWRLRDLLRRSSSDGGVRGLRRSDDLASLSSSISPVISPAPEYVVVKGKKSTAAANKVKREKAVSAHEEFYVRSKAKKEGEKRRSYLPYRQGVVGFFANANYVAGSGGFGLGRAVPPF